MAFIAAVLVAFFIGIFGSLTTFITHPEDFERFPHVPLSDTAVFCLAATILIALLLGVITYRTVRR